MLYSNFFPLLKKEFKQLLRNRQLLYFLLFIPLLQQVMYCLALDPQVKNLNLGIIDYCNTDITRELTAYLTNNEAFLLKFHKNNELELINKIKNGDLDVGIIINPDFERNLKANKKSSIQVLIDGVDANSANIASGYIGQLIYNFSQLLNPYLPKQAPVIKNEATFLYNPGLISAWFFSPGVIGMVLTIIGILVSSSSLLREREIGTLDQLLMAPVTTGEILMAKLIPLIIVLFINVIIGLSIGFIFFKVPFKGSFIDFVIVTFIAIIIVLSIGITLATVSNNQRQAMLMSFFISLPLMQLSGAIAPLESIPEPFQTLTYFDPLRYYVICIKAVLLKGADLSILWPQILPQLIMAVILITLSSHKFRKQLN